MKEKLWKFFKTPYPIIIIIIAVVFAAVLYSGVQDNKSAEKADLNYETASVQKPEPEKNEKADGYTEEKAGETEEKAVEKAETTPEKEEKSAVDEVQAEAMPQAETLPPEEQQLTCTLSVRCDTLLKNIGKMKPEKAAIVPENGVIFEEKQVVFFKDESVFNVLKREMRNNKIHMEFENAPIYGSAYIEAIGNIYEFDCGELSGWMYRVNGVFPNYGCSKYILNDGDRVEWIYSCDLGRDIGGGDVPGNGRINDE